MGFGDFQSICYRSMVPLCSVVGSTSATKEKIGIEASCYARNIELANTIIFQGAASFMHIAALSMTVIMIIHIRSKFTAVGTYLNIILDISTNSMINRTKRNYVFFLHLHVTFFYLPYSGLWCSTPW